MKRIKRYALCLLATVAMFGCSKYDDTELKKDVNDLKSRVEKLETWCNTANGQITALQGIVAALEKNDYVSGVTPIVEGTKEVGYTITFAKSNPITIMHGKNGANGTNGKDGITPIIGVKQDTDGQYYWTIQVGNAAATWMTDTAGNKIRTTGDKGNDGADGNDGTDGSDGADGHSPVLSVDDFEGRYYWKVDGEWLLSNGQKVPATGDKGATGDNGEAGAQGPQGDAIFAKDGIDYTTDPANVIFTLADGTTKITLPRQSVISVSIGDSSEDNAVISIKGATTLSINFPATFKESDYSAIMAEVVAAGDIVTRANSDWKVKITKPTFTNGTYNQDAKVMVTPVTALPGTTSIIRITVIDKRGKEVIASRPILSEVEIDVVIAAGGLKAAVEAALSEGGKPETIYKLTVSGSLNGDVDQAGTDYHYISQKMKSLEELTLVDATSIPDKALKSFWSTPNLSLKKISAPQVTAIGKSSFQYCKALESVDMPLLQTIGESAFYGCAGLKEFKSSSVTAIAASAFYGCSSLESISFPNVGNIERYTFTDCAALVSISLPDVTTIGEYGFKNCLSLTSLTDLMLPKLEILTGANSFEGCTRLTNVSLSEITSIGASTFINSTSLEEVSMPKALAIAGNTFSGCSSLKTVNLPEATSIKDQAFTGCTSLETISLPKAEELASSVFWKCSALKNVVLPEVKTLASRVFSSCSGLKSVELCTATGHPGLTTVGTSPFVDVPTTNIELIMGAGEIAKTSTVVGDNQEWKRYCTGDAVTYYRFKKITQK